jgi:hypothetical protein
LISSICSVSSYSSPFPSEVKKIETKGNCNPVINNNSFIMYYTQSIISTSLKVVINSNIFFISFKSESKTHPQKLNKQNSDPHSQKHIILCTWNGSRNQHF